MDWEPTLLAQTQFMIPAEPPSSPMDWSPVVPGQFHTPSLVRKRRAEESLFTQAQAEVVNTEVPAGEAPVSFLRSHFGVAY
jgi:hypothetical protein